MKKSVTFTLLLAVFLTVNTTYTYADTPTTTETTCLKGQHPKHSKRSKPHHKKKPVPPVGSHYKKRPAHCIEITFNHTPYFYANGIFYRPERSGYVVVRPQIGMIVPALPAYDVCKIKRKGKTLYAFNDILYSPIPAPQGIKFQIVGFLPIK